MPATLPTVVLVHGAFTDASIWHAVIATLQQRGHRVLTLAMPMQDQDETAAELGQPVPRQHAHPAVCLLASLTRG